MRAALLLALALSACESPHPANGALGCNPDPAGKACPDDYYCESASNTCWRDGEAPDLGMDTDGGFNFDLATNADLTSPPDLVFPSDLTAPLAKGDACSTTEGLPCAAGLQCVDGVCCESACTGQCQACNLPGSLGSCANVQSGLPRGNRTPCAGAGTSCAGSCSGAVTCTYPGAGTICGAACNGTCQGNGSCSVSGGGACPNGFACAASACKTSCANNMDCQPNFACSAPNCVRVPESDCLDGVDNNGDGLADCQDPSCTAVVACVPAVTTGNEIGLFQAAACPATDFTLTSPEHQTLQAQPCGGCSCYVQTKCSTTMTEYAAADTSCGGAAATSFGIVGANDGNAGVCTAPPSVLTPGSVKFSSFTATANNCISTGAASAPTPSWGTTKNFCGTARTTNTCVGSNVCAPKPASGVSMCVRVPSAGAACPGGYPTQMGTWFDTFTPASCSCGTCTKNTNGACPTTGLSTHIYGVSTASDCSSEMNITGLWSGGDPLNTCQKQTPPGSCMFFCQSWANIAGAFFVGPITLASSGTCTRPSNTDVAAAPSGPSTICCQ